MSKISDIHAIVNLAREALQDFTFSNGVTLPAGTHIGVATNPTHMDKVRSINAIVENEAHTSFQLNYENPENFDGFRYAEMREEDGESLKHQSVALGNDYFVFGTGRHAWYLFLWASSLNNASQESILLFLVLADSLRSTSSKQCSFTFF